MVKTFVDALPQRRGQSIMRNKIQSSARSAKTLPSFCSTRDEHRKCVGSLKS